MNVKKEIKIFLSWSGIQSKAMAQILHRVIKSMNKLDLKTRISPWLSNKIETGEAWRLEIKKKAANSSIGIVCFTNQNLRSPWIMYEIGLMHVPLEKGNVMPLIYKVENPTSNLPSVISEQQYTKFNIEGLVHVFLKISKILNIRELDFYRWWDEWEPKVSEEIDELDKVIDKKFQYSSVASLSWFGHDLMWILSNLQNKKEGWIICHGLAQLLHQAELIGIGAIGKRTKELLNQIELTLKELETSFFSIKNNKISEIKNQNKLNEVKSYQLEEMLRSLRDGIRHKINEKQPGYISHPAKYNLTRNILLNQRNI